MQAENVDKYGGRGQTFQFLFFLPTFAYLKIPIIDTVDEFQFLIAFLARVPLYIYILFY